MVILKDHKNLKQIQISLYIEEEIDLESMSLTFHPSTWICRGVLC
jgi:hypothetical protein